MTGIRRVRATCSSLLTKPQCLREDASSLAMDRDIIDELYSRCAERQWIIPDRVTSPYLCLQFDSRRFRALAILRYARARFRRYNAARVTVSALERGIYWNKHGGIEVTELIRDRYNINSKNRKSTWVRTDDSVALRGCFSTRDHSKRLSLLRRPSSIDGLLRSWVLCLTHCQLCTVDGLPSPCKFQFLKSKLKKQNQHRQCFFLINCKIYYRPPCKFQFLKAKLKTQNHSRQWFFLMTDKNIIILWVLYIFVASSVTHNCHNCQLSPTIYYSL